MLGARLFNRAYQSELAYLRQVGRAFGEAHPAIAAGLTQAGADPDVERLLEGFAFLTARVGQRAEDCVPEMAHELAEILLPSYVRPQPAATVLQFAPDIRAFRGRHRLPGHTPVLAQTDAGTVCQFRTTDAIDLLPLRLRSCHLEGQGAARRTLQLRFDMPQGAGPAIFQDAGVRLFCAQAYAEASNLWLALLRHSLEVRVEVGTQIVVLPPGSVSAPCLEGPNGFSAEAAPDAMVRAYFSLAQTYLFLDVRGLGTIDAAAAREFSITFELGDVPFFSTALPDEALRLHCVPAVNLFACDAIPLRRTALTGEQLIRPDGVAPEHAEVYAVATLQGVVPGQGVRHDYAAFSDFDHLRADGPGRFFRVRRELSPVDGAVDTYVSTWTAYGAAVQTAEEILSIDLLCTNRFLPQQLRRGGTWISPTTGLPVCVSQVTDVSPPVPPPLGKELYWRLLASLGGAGRGLTDAAALRRRLMLYNMQQHAGHATGGINARRIAGLSDFVTERIHRLVRGVPVGGVRTELTLEENHYASLGDAFLLSMVLDALLADGQPINTFSAVRLVVSPNRQIYSWPTRGIAA